jgi:hypothetical protein
MECWESVAIDRSTRDGGALPDRAGSWCKSDRTITPPKSTPNLTTNFWNSLKTCVPFSKKFWNFCKSKNGIN